MTAARLLVGLAHPAPQGLAGHPDIRRAGLLALGECEGPVGVGALEREILWRAAAYFAKEMK